MQTIHRVRSALALGLGCTMMLSACGVPEEAEAEGIESTQSSILNGTAVAPGDGIHVMLLAPVGDSQYEFTCSGTLITNEWVLTARHCETTTGTLVARANLADLSTATATEQQALLRGVSEVVNGPEGLDVTLVRLSSPYTISGRTRGWVTSLYPWDDARLVNQDVTCFGYGANQLDGAGGGTLRSGLMHVESAHALHQVTDEDGNVTGSTQAFTVVAAGAPPQLSFSGDSGGACFLNTNSAALVGVLFGGAVQTDEDDNVVAATESYYTPTALFSQWAIRTVGAAPGYSNAPYSGYPSFYLICHGQECVTRPVPPALLPNDIYEEAAWRPCPNLLSGPGSYEFDFEASYDLEQGYDTLLLNGEYRTGQGVITERTAASHFGNALSLYTDFSVNSVGLNYLRAHCPGDP